MGKSHTSVEEQVEYGLDAVEEGRTVKVPLRDLLYVQQTLGLFVNFFHQSGHYPDVEALHRFLGDHQAGAFHLLCECYYGKLRGVWPEDIGAGIVAGRFDNPVPPYYHEPTITEAEQGAA